MVFSSNIVRSNIGCFVYEKIAHKVRAQQTSVEKVQLTFCILERGFNGSNMRRE